MTKAVRARIAEKTIELRFPVLPLANHWGPFLVENGDHSIFQTIEEDETLFAMPIYGVSFYRGGIQGRIARSVSDPDTCMSYSADWAHVVTSGRSRAEMFELIITAFYSRLTTCEPSMLLHASAVKHEGEAVIFIGPSGIGKTTQAELWMAHLQAEILNGDKVFVRLDQQRPRAYGSPWSGYSPYIVNDSAPVRAIILLRQGPVNAMEKLTGPHAFTALSKHTFFPQWDGQCTANVMQMLNFVLISVPVFILTCRPDADAVRLTKQTIW
jgi:hypothetical protein